MTSTRKDIQFKKLNSEDTPQLADITAGSNQGIDKPAMSRREDISIAFKSLDPVALNLLFLSCAYGKDPKDPFFKGGAMLLTAEESLDYGISQQEYQSAAEELQMFGFVDGHLTIGRNVKKSALIFFANERSQEEILEDLQHEKPLKTNEG